MRIRIYWFAALVVAATLQGCWDHQASGDSTASNSGSNSSGSSSSGGGSTGSSPVSSTPPPTAATLPAVALTCGSPQVSANAQSISSASVDVELSGNDLAQTFTSGSAFTVRITTTATSADVLEWQISDHNGAAVTSGSFNAVNGSTTATMSCSSTLAGYFALSAHLQNSGASISHRGSRPHGFVSFGVLPNVADLLPNASPGPLDRHSFGLQGSNYIEAGVCCDGNGLQPINEHLGSTWVLDSRSQSSTEPTSTSKYNPATYPLNPGLTQGTLARVVTLNGIPSWASAAPSASSPGSYPPKSFDSFQNYTSLVGQETARVQTENIPNQQRNYYQVTWEPDPGTSTQWMGSDSQFVQLYEAAWKGVHATDPNAMVMGPTTSGLALCGQWLSRLAPLGLTKYLDAVACHGYYAVGTNSSTPPEAANLPAQMQQLRQTIASLMPAGTKLFITETGISYPRGAQYSPSYPTADVLLQHAEAVVRTHLILLGEGTDVSFLFYSSDYTYEVGFGLYFNLTLPNPNFGTPDISPKPAAMAVAAASRLIDGARSMGALTQLPSGAYGYSFLLAQDHAVTALWAHQDSFVASVPYSFQIDAAGTNGTAVVLDSMGNAHTVQYTNGLLTLTLSEMPTYVLSSNIGVLKSQLRAPQGYETGS